MQLDAPQITREADQSLGSRFAQKSVMSLTRVSKHLSGVVDLAATLFRGLAEAGKAALEGLGDHLSNVADAMAQMLSGEGFEGAAFQGAD